MKPSPLSSILQRFRSRSAETLAEVIIAITVLTLGTGSASILVTTSIRATTSGENRLVAYNLAREGVEMVRNIRDTNWLRFPGDRANCWDTYGVTNPALCGTANKLGGTDPGGQDVKIWPELEIEDKLFKWNVQVLPPNSSPQLYIIDTNRLDSMLIPDTLGGKFYTHDSTWSGGAIPSPYSRVVNIVKSGSSEMVVTSTVTWEENGNTVSIDFMDKLINY